MNSLFLVKTMARLRGQPFAVSTIPAPEDDADASTSEVATGLTRDQVPRREKDSDLTRSVVYAERDRAGRTRRLRMDVHVPKAPGPHPLVLYIPGGGFAVALFRQARGPRGYVADRGFVVASIEYRTVADDASFREGALDVVTAIDFLREHAGRFKIDSNNVALWGESAGGYLAALTATRSDPGDIRAVVDVAGASDLSQIADGFDDTAQAAWNHPRSTLTRYAGQPPATESNPVAQVTHDAPPFLLLAGADDRIVSPRQSLILHRALLAAGVESRRIVLPNAGHGALALPGGDVKVWSSIGLMDIVVDFLRSHTSTATAGRWSG